MEIWLKLFDFGFLALAIFLFLYILGDAADGFRDGYDGDDDDF
jgi:hypothetical protein